jgi:hypothetical protein
MSFETRITSAISGRQLAVATDEQGDLNFAIFGEPERFLEDTTISRGNAINLAIQILKYLDPDALAPTPFIDLPNGTFIRQITTGKIYRIIPTPEAFDHRELQDSENWAEDSEGKAVQIVQGPPSDPHWAVLDDDQVEIKTTWTFKL